jgi:ribosomal protein L11 methyltransferase
LLPRDFRPPSADAVLANILAAPLVRLKPLLLESLAPGGALVLSGILEEQAAAVEAVYRHGLTSVETKSMDGWVRLSGNKS